VRSLELRRHAPRDPEADRLSAGGAVLAEEVGATLPGGYDAVFTSPAKRAAETAAWFLRGLRQQLPPRHGVAEGLTSTIEDRWRSAAKAAGTGRIDAVRAQDPELVETDSARLAEAVDELISSLPEEGKGLAVGHSPLIEAAVYGLTGAVIEPLKECEGVLVEEDNGAFRVAEEYRRS
jgi:broad specificity phosphatase PhoE